MLFTLTVLQNNSVSLKIHRFVVTKKFLKPSDEYDNRPVFDRKADKSYTIMKHLAKWLHHHLFFVNKSL